LNITTPWSIALATSTREKVKNILIQGAARTVITAQPAQLVRLSCQDVQFPLHRFRGRSGGVRLAHYVTLLLLPTILNAGFTPLPLKDKVDLQPFWIPRGKAEPSSTRSSLAYKSQRPPAPLLHSRKWNFKRFGRNTGLKRPLDLLRPPGPAAPGRQHRLGSDTPPAPTGLTLSLDLPEYLRHMLQLIPPAGFPAPRPGSPSRLATPTSSHNDLRCCHLYSKSNVNNADQQKPWATPSSPGRPGNARLQVRPTCVSKIPSTVIPHL